MDLSISLGPSGKWRDIALGGAIYCSNSQPAHGEGILEVSILGLIRLVTCVDPGY